MSAKCDLCDTDEIYGAKGMMFCWSCGKAYDRFNARTDGTTADLIAWVARRVRRFERKRADARAKG